MLSEKKKDGGSELKPVKINAKTAELEKEKKREVKLKIEQLRRSLPQNINTTFIIRIIAKILK